ncbi:MAG: ATP-binding protein [Thermoanaerobaculia bacterium]|nr:ATP-binding protein [Thermoanaerobaculia bacterium]
MVRFFNTTGPCQPGDHFMLPPERRLPDVEQLIRKKRYFVIHAPRQCGKTTSLQALATRLTAEGRYTVLLTSCEVGQMLQPDVEAAIDSILAILRQRSEDHLPPDLRPPAPDPSITARARLSDLLRRWAQVSPRPLAVFFDEIDSLYDDVLISVLRQLRTGFSDRPHNFPQSVVLIGLRDVRDYRILSRLEADGDLRAHRLGSSSPFNIKSRSFTLPYFTAEEVAELYRQHTDETGQVWSDSACARAFELTGGQPWLVNALAEVVTDELLTDRLQPIEIEAIERAREILIQRRDTHLDSLIDRLREPRVRKVVAAIVSGELLPADVIDDDVEYVKDLGLVTSGPRGLEIANPIYREFVPRALTSILEADLVLPRPSYLGADGRLDFRRLFGDFKTFWIANAEEYLARAPYSEAAAQLVFMAFLHKLVNGGEAVVDREYAAGRGRVDLCVRWPLGSGEMQRFAVELEVWRDGHRADPVADGLDQLAGYLERLGLEEGALIVFDNRKSAPPLPERVSEREIEHAGRRMTLLRS